MLIATKPATTTSFRFLFIICTFFSNTIPKRDYINNIFQITYIAFPYLLPITQNIPCSCHYRHALQTTFHHPVFLRQALSHIPLPNDWYSAYLTNSTHNIPFHISPQNSSGKIGFLFAYSLLSSTHAKEADKHSPVHLKLIMPYISLIHLPCRSSPKEGQGHYVQNDHSWRSACK